MLPTTLCQSLFGGEPIHLKKVLILILLIVSKQIKSQQNSLKPPIQTKKLRLSRNVFQKSPKKRRFFKGNGKRLPLHELETTRNPHSLAAD